MRTSPIFLPFFADALQVAALPQNRRAISLIVGSCFGLLASPLPSCARVSCSRTASDGLIPMSEGELQLGAAWLGDGDLALLQDMVERDRDAGVGVTTYSQNVA